MQRFRLPDSRANPSNSLNMCKHENFRAEVNVHRLTGEEPMRFNSDIKIFCAVCGLPFRFRGLPVGLLLDGAAMNFDGTEARFAIVPSDQPDPGPVQGLNGFVVKGNSMVI